MADSRAKKGGKLVAREGIAAKKRNPFMKRICRLDETWTQTIHARQFDSISGPAIAISSLGIDHGSVMVDAALALILLPFFASQRVIEVL